jgi:hypothetical protein
MQISSKAHSTLKIEAECLSETSVDFQWAAWRIPEDRNLHKHNSYIVHNQGFEATFNIWRILSNAACSSDSEESVRDVILTCLLAAIVTAYKACVFCSVKKCIEKKPVSLNSFPITLCMEGCDIFLIRQCLYIYSANMFYVENMVLQYQEFCFLLLFEVMSSCSFQLCQLEEVQYTPFSYPLRTASQ